MSVHDGCVRTAAALVCLLLVDSADAAAADVVLEHFWMPAAGSASLETGDGTVRATLVVGEAGPVGVSESSPPGVVAHFGVLRVIRPAPEPGGALLGMAALAALALWRRRKGSAQTVPPRKGPTRPAISLPPQS